MLDLSAYIALHIIIVNLREGKRASEPRPAGLGSRFASGPVFVLGSHTARARVEFG